MFVHLINISFNNLASVDKSEYFGFLADAATQDLGQDLFHTKVIVYKCR